MIDSGVNPAHPHLRDGVSGFSGCATDSLGHGTAVAAAICDLAPNVWIHSIAVLDASGRCSCDRVIEAIDEAISSEVDLINLSVGLLGVDLEGRFGDVLKRVEAAGARLVAPATQEGMWCFPGCMAGVEGVVVDSGVPREAPQRREHEGAEYWFASPYPRDLPGLSKDRNLRGVSLSVANVTGHLAGDLLRR